MCVEEVRREEGRVKWRGERREEWRVLRVKWRGERREGREEQCGEKEWHGKRGKREEWYGEGRSGVGRGKG